MAIWSRFIVFRSSLPPDRKLSGVLPQPRSKIPRIWNWIIDRDSHDSTHIFVKGLKCTEPLPHCNQWHELSWQTTTGFLWLLQIFEATVMYMIIQYGLSVPSWSLIWVYQVAERYWLVLYAVKFVFAALAYDTGHTANVPATRIQSVSQWNSFLRFMYSPQFFQLCSPPYAAS